MFLFGQTYVHCLLQDTSYDLSVHMSILSRITLGDWNNVALLYWPILTRYGEACVSLVYGR